MQLKPKDTYRIETVDSLNISSMTSLISLYQPIIGHEALVFYLTCCAEGSNQRTLETHQRLCIIMNMDIPTIERARKKCEQFYLIRTFIKSDNDKDTYIYIVNPPLSAQAFMKHDFYSRYLCKLIGQKQYELTCSKVMKQETNKHGYSDVSEQFDKNLLTTWDTENEVQFSKIQPNFNFSDQHNHRNNFNYEELFATTSSIVFPIETRTKENLQIIGEYATLYGLSVSKIRILIGRCINNSTNTFDVERFKKICSTQNPDEVTTTKDPYLLPPVAFLQLRQEGAPVASVDRKLLEYLNLDLKLPAEVVNVLIDYVLNINENRLTKRFVEVIATTWVREKVTTKEQAMALTKKTPAFKSQPNKKKDVLPDYYEKMKAKEKEETLNIISEEEEEEIVKKLKGLGE